MGQITHHAVMFREETWRGSTFGDVARSVIAEIAADGFVLAEDWQTLFVETPVMANGGRSFAFMPDGSKEGWDTSDVGDSIRDALIALATERGMDFIEVRFGGDDYDMAGMTRSSGDDRPNDGGDTDG